MAEALLIPVANGILNGLLPIVTNQISQAWGFKQDLEKLRERLEIIQAFIEDADNRKITSQAMTAWLERLKAAICDAENVLDELAYEALRRRIEFFPRLRELAIWGCPMLITIPDAAFKSSTSLQRLTIWHCLECEKDSGEDWHKIARIPTIYMNWRRVDK
ncbi:hypothetical protein Vadar_015547 [Vaccinium darrowii]|uniref:Uncharacterized protein n=1 Tax=Vaccinium darrowii TaxID=229202 RepID=A0ACB7X133_9ERIC|nr:hypothetical protein Vadar_015547 [Vaccinium darrowii]